MLRSVHGLSFNIYFFSIGELGYLNIYVVLLKKKKKNSDGIE